MKGSPSCSDLVNSLIKFWPSPPLQVFLEPLAGSCNTEGRCIYRETCEKEAGEERKRGRPKNCVIGDLTQRGLGVMLVCLFVYLFFNPG